MSEPTVILDCCCCGLLTRGRQWWNRDTGYGLCNDCIDTCQVADVPIGGTASSYGVRGIHWDVKEDEEVRCRSCGQPDPAGLCPACDASLPGGKS